MKLILNSIRLNLVFKSFLKNRFLNLLKKNVSLLVLAGVILSAGISLADPEKVDYSGFLPEYDNNIRYRAGRIIKAANDRSAIPAFIAVLKDSDPKLSRMSLEALVQLKALEAAPHLIELSKDPSSAIRLQCLDALAALGAKEAVPAILELAKDPQKKVRTKAIQTLKKLGYKFKKKPARPKQTAVKKTSRKIKKRPSTTKYLSKNKTQQSQKFPHRKPSRAEMLRKLIYNLKFGNEQARISAIKELAEMKEMGSAVFISQQLNHQSQNARQEAARALAVLGAKECIPALLGSLGNPDPETAIVIIEAIICLDPDKTESVLKKCLLHGDPKVCIAAIKYVKDNRITQLTDQLMDLLADRDLSVRIAACQALGELKVQKSIRAVCGMLKAKDAAERETAIAALGKIGHKDAAPYLVGRLDKVELDEYTDILKALVKIAHPSAAPYLMEGLGSEEANIRLIAVKGLGQFLNKEIAMTLIEIALADAEDDVRHTAVTALKGYDLNIIGDVLMDQLENEDREIRKRSIKLLGEFAIAVDISYLEDLFEEMSIKEQGLILEALGKGQNSSNIQLVLRALSRKERVLKEKAIEALSGMMGQEAGPYLEPLLKDDDRRVRFKAALELVPRGNAGAAEILIEALKDEYIETRDLAEKALLGFKNKNIIPKLALVFKDENYLFRYFATISSHDKYGKKEAVPQLKKDLKAKDLWIRYAALKALYFFKDPAAQDDLRAVLEQGDLLSRVMAARTLGAIGRQTKSAKVISALNSCLVDESPEVRCAIIEALGMIRHKDVRGILEKKLEAPAKSVRYAAAFSLAKWSEPKTVPILCKAIKAEDVETRYKAAKAFYYTCNKQAVPLLRGIYYNNDESPLVKEAVLKALKKAGFN